MKKGIDRRTLLRMLGASAAGGALSPWLGSRQAHAQEGDVPQRILFVEVGHGARRTTWEPSLAGPIDVTSTEVSTDWSFRPVMEALAPYRDRINMFQNLDMVSVREDPTAPANAHIDGGTHMLTATDRFEGSSELGGGVSIDQLIAQQLNAGGLVSRLASLEVLADEHSSQYATSENRDAYATPGQKLPFLKYVPDIWDHIFPNPLDPDAAAQAERVAKKTSVYDHVRGDYEGLIARLGGADRAKIQAMLDLRAQLHGSLTLFNDREINRPDAETVFGPWSELEEGYLLGNLDNRLWSVHVDLVSQMVAAALHTDTTRVANYIIEIPPDYEFGYVPGTVYDGVSTTDWHDLDHKVSGDNPEVSAPPARLAIEGMQRRTYEKLRELLDLMASLPETDGQSLLDHTLVVVVSHIAEGSHDVTRLPWMTIGNAHGRLRTGRYVRFPIRHFQDGQVGQLTYPANASERIYNYRGRPHNDFFVTLAQAMGLSDITTFGRSFAQNEGAITEILI